MSFCRRMRLTHIKLSGFKSFAETTTIPVPGQLVAVVGPNGCGKSNVMDAVRWVLGESSAKQLRGESMQDVIFNGAATRRAAARASVELVFDNSSGTLGGAWGQYAEISIKRQLSRQGESHYLINGQTVRRRDITELFLGTGAGARGYAVIEQGMISRIIEARPEELRGYLEEAAGVSKYKERRRETAQRLADTRAHLQRLADMRQELDRQTDKLREQAAAAEQHQTLSRELAQLQDLADFILWQHALHEADLAQARHQTAQSEYEHSEQQLHTLEDQYAELHTQEQQHQQQRHSLNREHALLREQKARLEEQLHAQRRHREQQQQQRSHAQAALQVLAQEADALQQQLTHAHSRLQEHQRDSQALVQALEQQQRAAEAAQSHCQNRRDHARQCQNTQQHARHQAELAQQQVQYAEHSLHERQNRLARLAQQHQQDDHTLAAQQALTEADTRQHQHDTLAEAVLQLENEQTQLHQHCQSAEHAYRDVHARWLQAQAEAHALAQWQDEQADFWQHLPDCGSILWQQLDVDETWRQAVYVLLGARLNARAPAEEPVLTDLPAGEAVWLHPSPSPLAASVRADDALLNRIRLPDHSLFTHALAHWLAGVRCADNWQQAWARRHELADGESWLTPAGQRIDRIGVYLNGTPNPHHQRAAELDRLQQHSQALADECQLAEQHWQQQRARAQSHQQHLAEQQQALRQAAAELAHAQQHAAQWQARCEQQAQQLARLQSEQEQAQQEYQDAENRLAQARAQLAQCQSAAATAEQQARTAENELSAAEQAAQHARQSAAHSANAHRRAQEQEAYWQGLHQQHSQSLADNRRQQTHQQALLDESQAQQGHWPDYEEQLLRLDSLDEMAAQAEEQQAELAQQLQQLQQQLHHTDQQRRHLQAQLPHRQNAVQDALLLQQQSLLSAKQHYNELVERHGSEPDNPEHTWAHLKTAAANAPAPSLLKQRAAAVRRRIEALGAVNLAALQELTQAQERSDYYRNQNDDLQQAAELLEQAIAQIDRETESRFRDTFEQANRHMAHYFPTLFGGGEAALVLAQDGGVSIHARPPGKKNSTIQLLSGGEKALTAMSLVFALFSLNPAPFCLLDEVDAPLDDANTGRFCRLVKQMSANTQFLYISHNRLTMEMAEQLIGITMQEKGVSRMVAVDIRQAAEFARTNDNTS
nr:chromosome segregation protein SMC [Conchiformibius steedae]